MKTTNYTNAFIEVADDCPAALGEAPPRGEVLSAAAMQYEMIANAPYTYTSDDVVFRVHQLKHGICNEDADAERGAFFAKGQPCLRSSALAKRYGWGIHSDEQGRVALYGRESERYAELAADAGVKHLKAMRNARGGV